MSSLEAVAVLAAVAVGAAAQASTGLGFSLVCAPFLIATLGPREGVRVGLALSLVLNLALLLRGHRRVLVRTGAVLAVPAVAATPLLAAAVRRMNGRVLAAVAGALTIASAGALAVGSRWQRATRPLAGVGVGVLSAAMNVVGSIGGPPLALFAVNADWPRDHTGPTLQTIFLTTKSVGLASLGLISFDLRLFSRLRAGRNVWALLVVIRRRVAAFGRQKDPNDAAAGPSVVVGRRCRKGLAQGQDRSLGPATASPRPGESHRCHTGGVS